MKLLTQLQDLSDQLTRETNIQKMKEYSRLLIDLATEVWLSKNYATKTKLEYDRMCKERFAELIEELKAVSKTNEQVELEHMDQKETYKEAESEYDKLKLLYDAHVNNLWICKLDVEQWTTADVSVNSNKDVDDSFPF